MPFAESRDGGDALAIRSIVLGAALVGLAALSGSGCSSDEGRPSEQSAPDAHATHRPLVQSFDDRLVDIMRREVRRRARTTAIVDELQASDHGTASDDSTELTYRSLLESSYARHDYEGRWFRATPRGYRLATSGRRLFDHLESAVESHGLWPNDLHLLELRKLRNLHEARVGPPELDARLALTSEERAALLRQLDRRDEPLEREEAMPILADIAAEPEGPTPRLAEAVAESASGYQREAARVARMELLLSDALVEYAVEMRYGNPAWHEPKAWRATLRTGDRGPVRRTRPDGEEKERPTAAEHMRRAVQSARTRAMAAEMMSGVWSEREAIGTIMSRLQPPYRQYDRLTRAFRHYRTAVERGGWPEVDPLLEGFTLGTRHPSIETLKARLHLEGYFPDREEWTPDFTPELESAIRAYQKTHQIWGEGKITAATIRSLNVSAERRWHQIRVTLDRWRRSRIGADRHYIHVNIPDYHAELWKDGTRKMRFRVVVGSSAQRKEGGDEEEEDEDGETQRDEQQSQTDGENEEGELVYFRSTPRFSGEIGYMVLNPYWNVPHGIWKNELEPKQEDDPDYYDEHGYEVVEDDNGHRFLRQKPGPDNALGRVKFLFPNEYSVYLHDTNKPQLFDRPFRAFSHGCIRIEKPMKLLHYLLDLDGRWTGDRRKELLTKWFQEKEERWLNLRASLPIHIEYYVARIGDEGRAHFGADIYDLDEPKLEKVERRMDNLPGGYDLPQLSHEDRLQAALDGELRHQTSLREGTIAVQTSEGEDTYTLSDKFKEGIVPPPNRSTSDDDTSATSNQPDREGDGSDSSDRSAAGQDTSTASGRSNSEADPSSLSD